MCLTPKERRLISSPATITGKRRANVRYRMRKKVAAILDDVGFLLENAGRVRDETGLDVRSVVAGKARGGPAVREPGQGAAPNTDPDLL